MTDDEARALAQLRIRALRGGTGGGVVAPPASPADNLARRQAAYMTWLVQDCGYRDPRLLPTGKIACVVPFAFTYAILLCELGDHAGYDDRWCYRSYASAKKALAAWDGTGEPAGWHRHPDSGRRREPGEPERVWL